MKRYKPNERIPFTDDIMFSMVLRNESICRQLLERIIPQEQFGEIRIDDKEELFIETQKNIKFPLGFKGVRLDAFVKTQNMWAEIELQTYTGDHIAKRSRYYHANMDLDFLKEGQPYHKIPRSYVIFICTYDYIGAGKPVYWFSGYDKENDLPLGDESVTIILNTAADKELVPSMLRDLFEYINEPGRGAGDSLVDEIDKQVDMFNTDDWRRKHMTIGELMDRNYEEGRKEGRKEGREEGREEGVLDVAKKMKVEGIPTEMIMKTTGLSKEEIERL